MLPSGERTPPKWSSVKVQAISPGVPWTEPRITVGPDGTLWLVTNGEKSSTTTDDPEQVSEENTAPAIVMFSTDGGNTWQLLAPATLAGLQITAVIALNNGSADPNAQTVLVAASGLQFFMVSHDPERTFAMAAPYVLKHAA